MDHARYREQIAAALAGSKDAIMGSFIVAISTLAGEHGFGGDFGVRLRKLHDYGCGLHSEGDVYRRELKALAKIPKKELEKAAEEPRIHRTEGPLTPALVEQHCSMCDDNEIPAAPDDRDLWTALYAPAYLLGWSDLAGAERDLLTLPMTVGPTFNAAALRQQTEAAIKRARHAYPALALDAASLDYTSATHFGWSLSKAMSQAAASFDRSAPAPSKGGKKPKKAVPPPDMKPMEELLYERTVKALRAWSKANATSALALLGFDGTPPEDNVGICFGSEATFDKTIAWLEPDATASRKALDYKHWELTGGTAAWLARFDVGHADGHYEAEVKLPKYARFAGSDDAPVSKRPDGITWGDGTLRVLFTRVLQRVVESGELAKVRCAPTLYLVYTMHVRLERRVEAAGERLELLGGQLRFGVRHPVLRDRHTAGADREAGVDRERVGAVPLGEVDDAAPVRDVVLDDPRHRRDVRVPRPLRLVAMAVEAGPNGERAGPGRVPLRLLDRGRIGVRAAIRDELHEPEQDDEASERDQQSLEEAGHYLVHTALMPRKEVRDEDTLPQVSAGRTRGATRRRASARPACPRTSRRPERPRHRPHGMRGRECSPRAAHRAAPP
jgi:hypothetical protein